VTALQKAKRTKKHFAVEQRQPPHKKMIMSNFKMTSAVTKNGSSSSSKNSNKAPLTASLALQKGGLARMAPTILMGWTILTTVYAAFYYAFFHATTILGLTPADEFCVNSLSTTHCARPDLFAFQCSSGCAILICATLGFYTWTLSRRVHTLLPSTPPGRLFGYLPEAEFLAAVNFTFQSWDFCISLTIPEHATVIMLTHHVLAATVSLLSVTDQYLHYYGIFFLGLSEVSSLFLVFVDMSRFFPPTQPGSVYDIFIGMFAGPLFVVCFIYYRVIRWWPVSRQLYMDAHHVLSSGQAQKLRPGKDWILYVYLGANLPLGILQLYWTTEIFREVQKVLFQ
jgi:TLC domain